MTVKLRPALILSDDNLFHGTIYVEIDIEAILLGTIASLSSSLLIEIFIYDGAE
jgi:hypothetical protein